MDFKQVTNPSSGENQLRAEFPAELATSISEVTRENKNGTVYHLASVKFPSKEGPIITRSCMVYAKTKQLADEQGGFKIGEKYKCTATITPGRTDVLLSLSHLLTNADRAAVKDFDTTGAESEPIAVSESATTRRSFSEVDSE